MGIKERWQLALLLPERWDDLTKLVEDFEVFDTLEEGGPIVIRGSLAAAPPPPQFKNGQPRTRLRIVDGNGEAVETMLFGDVRETLKDLEAGSPVLFSGEVSRGGDGNRWLRKAERIDSQWAGQLRPIYPAPRGVMKAATVRERVSENIEEAIPVAARWIYNEVCDAAGHIGFPVKSTVQQVEAWLWESHRPETIEKGMKAQRRVEMLAVLATLSRAYSAKGGDAKAHPLDLGAWEKRLEGVPFAMTEEQQHAVQAMVRQFASSIPQRHLLSGDVGTGKTVVFALVAAATVDAGHCVAIMLPNQPLAQQVAREIGEMWPEINVREVSGTQAPLPLPDGEPGIFVGTTALLTRLSQDDLDRIALVVVDEQQKYSVAQREQLAKQGAHLLEATATCIPRTMALIRYGAMEVSQLRQAHTPKDIVTEVVRAADAARVFGQIRRTIEKGYQALVVYPLKEGDPDDRLALENAIKKWRKQFGERVAMISGGMDDEEKRTALDRMRKGEADVLIGTTVVEVGISLPALRHIVIADASRYGLTQIHQLRGRVARQGGSGLCSLIVPDTAKEKVFERLSVLEKTQDGFEVAEHDLRLRGFGDLSQDGGTQSGSDETFLFGRKIDVDLADRVAGEIQERLGMAAA
ncbi:DEAD/DEAH box helicase [Thioalkalivibrio sp. ALE16]|uniref:DEAD/DEAH box helicase n=1 Tax=Thioalkalivibrio sp. ALE16 TaxID=1158172 RepID=UPI001E5A5EE3|nr:DEAD/DEAH box helicase [Thioalkalivibrio sp. ALE16]